MKYFFSCQKCGRYEVEKKLFVQLITPELREKLEKSIQGGAIKAELEFASVCHKCKDITKKVRMLIRLKITKPRKELRPC